MKASTQNGYIIFRRSFLEHPLWLKPSSYLKVFIYLITHAQHKEYKGLKRGQLFTSIPEIIANTCWWVGARKEHLTKDQVFNILEWMRKPIETQAIGITTAPLIATTKATHGMLVTINDYNGLQDPNNYESNNESSAGTSSRAARSQRKGNNINKNVKNVNNDKNINTDQFDIFWGAYNKKISKEECLKLFYKIPEQERLNILAHVNDFVSSNPDTKYRPNPATYLRNKRWNDEIIPKRIRDNRPVI